MGEKLLDIAKRDGWVCGICCLPIDPTLSPFESDQAATYDHIVPRIAGGSNDDENLQAAHLACNWSKLANIVAAQRFSQVKG